MGYTPIGWKDRIVQRPRTYTEVMNQDGSRTDTPAPGEVQEQGTQMSATNFNHMDEGIHDDAIAEALLMNYARQSRWRIEDLEKATVQETGSVTLTNTQGFPFNNSKVSVPLTNQRDNLNYIVVIVSATGAGNVGEIEVSERLVNGFKIEFTGSASSVTVVYAVIGGYN